VRRRKMLGNWAAMNWATSGVMLVRATSYVGSCVSRRWGRPQGVHDVVVRSADSPPVRKIPMVIHVGHHDRRRLAWTHRPGGPTGVRNRNGPGGQDCAAHGRAPVERHRRLDLQETGSIMRRGARPCGHVLYRAIGHDRRAGWAKPRILTASTPRVGQRDPRRAPGRD